MMNRDIVLLLGGNRLNYGIIKKFKDRNLQVYVIDWNEVPDLTGDRHYQIDVKKSEEIIAALEQDKVLDRVLFAYSSIDLAVPSVAKINSKIGLRTISKEGLNYSSSKSKMTSRWREKGLLNRVSLCYNRFSESIVTLNKRMKIIIKPDNSASSRGITIVNKNSDAVVVEKAFNRAQKEASDGIVVVEEFVEGTEYTVEMIGDSYGNVCVYGISRKTHSKNTENNSIAIKLHYNAVDNELQNRIAEFGIKCFKALHFSSSLGHLEVIVKDNGTMSPVEIGARSSGNIASDLIDVVSGVSYLDELVQVHTGKRIQNGLHRQTEFSSMYFFYDFPSGSFIKKEGNLLNYCDSAISSRLNDRRFLSLGNTFSKIDSDNARYGYEVLEGTKKIMTIDAIEKAENRMMEDILGYGPNI